MNIQELDRRILININYSSKDNFLKQDIYENLGKCYLRRETPKVISNDIKKLKKYNSIPHFPVYDDMSKVGV